LYVGELYPKVKRRWFFLLDSYYPYISRDERWLRTASPGLSVGNAAHVAEYLETWGMAKLSVYEPGFFEKLEALNRNINKLNFALVASELYRVLERYGPIAVSVQAGGGSRHMLCINGITDAFSYDLSDEESDSLKPIVATGIYNTDDYYVHVIDPEGGASGYGRIKPDEFEKKKKTNPDMIHAACYPMALRSLLGAIGPEPRDSLFVHAKAFGQGAYPHNTHRDYTHCCITAQQDWLLKYAC